MAADEVTTASRAFAERMRRFRQSYGMSQKQLAQLLGIQRGTVQSVEYMERQPYASLERSFERLEKRFREADAREIASLEGLS